MDKVKTNELQLRIRPVRNFLIVTRTPASIPYVIEGEDIEDLIKDWKRGGTVCPSDNERVLFFMFGGDVVNPYEYTDFRSVICWISKKLGKLKPFKKD